MVLDVSKSIPGILTARLHYTMERFWNRSDHLCKHSWSCSKLIRSACNGTALRGGLEWSANGSTVQCKQNCSMQTDTEANCVGVNVVGTPRHVTVRFS